MVRGGCDRGGSYEISNGSHSRAIKGGSVLRNSDYKNIDSYSGKKSDGQTKSTEIVHWKDQKKGVTDFSEVKSVPSLPMDKVHDDHW